MISIAELCLEATVPGGTFKMRAISSRVSRA
jgi:hypothetical protein